MPFVARPLVLAALAGLALAPAQGRAQSSDSLRAALAPAQPLRAMSAPIANVRYEVAFDDTLARRRTIHVSMSFDVTGPGPVVLSLPVWTPGAYELGNFARYVSGFRATVTDRGAELPWDKVDYDSWRVQPMGARAVTVTFDYLANVFDNAQAWATDDFAFFNGTNVFLYPEGRGFNWGATVTVRAPTGWRVATGMSAVSGQPRTFRAADYHDLVDFPFLVGQLDVDSTQIAGRTFRMVTYPQGALRTPIRNEIWRQFRAFAPSVVQLFGDAPFDTYTLLQVVDTAIGGASGLEHQNSQLDLITPFGLGSPDFAPFYAHELVHAWNVKRLRPADMVPYEYEAPQPTTWLWVSEGLTDYFGNVTAVRGKAVEENAFYALFSGQMSNVERNPTVSLEDASLDTWIKPTGTDWMIYYDKGAIAGLALDILIRDASDNRNSLDDVMRELYRSTWKRTGRGFTGADWWGTIAKAAAGRSFDDFRRRYVEGREAFPWDSILPKAGMALRRDTIREPRVGISTLQDSGGMRVNDVVPGSVAAEAGIVPGDVLVKFGDVDVTSPDWGARYRSLYGQREGAKIPVIVRRDGQALTLTATVKLAVRVNTSLAPDPKATGKALRIRDGILKGTTDAPRAPGATGGAR